MTARPPPRLSTRLWTGQTPVCRLVTTLSVPMSSVLTQAEAVTVNCLQILHVVQFKGASVEVLLILPDDPKAAIPAEGFKL